MSGFARASGVNAQRLSWWRKRFEAGGDATAPAVTPMAFIPAAVVGSTRVVVRLAGGVDLEGDAAALPAGWVAALVRELGKA